MYTIHLPTVLVVMVQPFCAYNPNAIANIIYQNSSKFNDFRFSILNKSFSIEYRYFR